jgi:hypothetical protein
MTTENDGHGGKVTISRKWLNVEPDGGILPLTTDGLTGERRYGKLIKNK